MDPAFGDVQRCNIEVDRKSDRLEPCIWPEKPFSPVVALLVKGSTARSSV